MHEILNSYLKKLTNLSSSNRSVYLPRLSSNHFMDLMDINFAEGIPSFRHIEQLIKNDNRIVLCPYIDSRSQAVNQSSNTLKKIERNANYIFEERGTYDLYVGWPFVQGKFTDGTLVRCALLYFPVFLSRQAEKWQLSYRKEIPVTFNKSFLLAYSYYNNIKISEDFIDYNFEDFEQDSQVFRNKLYQLIEGSPLELHFNPDNFSDELQPFKSYRKQELEEETQLGKLKLFPQAVLGIFPQSGSYLVPDYLELINNPQTEDIESFFVQRTLKPAADQTSYINQVQEENTYTPYKLDAYQENAIKAVKKGNSVVVQGPPGSGKSQLICNLISDFIARGKRVLLVCQKKAALDVVAGRLHEHQISDFTALVHDFKLNRPEIYKQIALQIDRIDEYRQKNNSLDSIQLERNFLKACRKIDQISEKLEEFKFALYDTNECGISVKELYLTSDLKAPSIPIKQEYNYFKILECDDFHTKLARYYKLAKKFRAPEYPWFHRRNFKSYSMQDFREIKHILEQILPLQQEICKEVGEILQTEVNFSTCEYFLSKQKTMLSLLDIVQDKAVYELFRHLIGFSDSETDLLWLANIERLIIDCYKDNGVESTVPSGQLGHILEVLQMRLQARKGVRKWIKWVFSKEDGYLKKVLRDNKLNPNKEGLQILQERLDNRLNLEHNLTKLKKKQWAIDLPHDYNKLGFQTWFYYQKKAIGAKHQFGMLRNFKEYFNVQKLTIDEFEKQIKKLLAIISQIPAYKERWLKYLTANNLTRISEHQDYLEQLTQSLEDDFESICEFDALNDSLNKIEATLIDRLIDSDNEVGTDDIVSLFQNSLRLAWIDHIEMKYPVLRLVSSEQLTELERELADAIKVKHQVSKDILLLKIREETYQDASFNRLNNMVTYRELYHQVTKKRKIWPLRKVLQHFGSELFKLMPCWLASPETVSAIFPMERHFDLVIFDEASQCFAEKGIPAMYRGRQVVVVGDHQQLAPNDLYQVRWEEDDPSSMEVEIDSLLGLAEQHLTQVELRGHYRSKYFELIDFSNKHFYRNELQLLPEFEDLKSTYSAIEVIEIEGVWENNCNEQEANVVVEQAFNIFERQPDKSLGIVTFNNKQQELIIDLLEQQAAERQLELPRSLIIKNIENIQGDEKDIILFSIGYAPDKKGKMLMQFGSLNRQGGENRLNVAITRAKEKIIVVTSIKPHQLTVDESKNQGPKLLKAYLAYCFDVHHGKFAVTHPNLGQQITNWYLNNKLADMIDRELNPDIELVRELPFTDLTIKKNERYAGVILTDDDYYFQSLSVKDAHAYKPFELSRKKWPFFGVFSRQYWKNPEQIKQKMMQYIKEIRP